LLNRSSVLTKVLSKFIITLAMRKTHRDLHAEDQTMCRKGV